MSRILFSWDIGGNLGHIARDLPLALACRGAGHEVLFTVTDLTICRNVAARYELRFVQAPGPEESRPIKTCRRRSTMPIKCRQTSTMQESPPEWAGLPTKLSAKVPTTCPSRSAT